MTQVEIGLSEEDMAIMESGIVSEVSFDFLVRIAMLLETPIHIQPKKLKRAA